MLIRHEVFGHLVHAFEILYLNKVRPPASPNITGVCGGTWKYPFPFWTLFSCSPFTAGKKNTHTNKTALCLKTGCTQTEKISSPSTVNQFHKWNKIISSVRESKSPFPTHSKPIRRKLVSKGIFLCVFRTQKDTSFVFLCGFAKCQDTVLVKLKLTLL